MSEAPNPGSRRPNFGGGSNFRWPENSPKPRRGRPFYRLIQNEILEYWGPQNMVGRAPLLLWRISEIKMAQKLAETSTFRIGWKGIKSASLLTKVDLDWLCWPNASWSPTVTLHVPKFAPIQFKLRNAFCCLPASLFGVFWFSVLFWGVLLRCSFWCFPAPFPALFWGYFSFHFRNSLASSGQITLWF